MKKEYLGDGLYCEVEHAQFKLTTENGISITNTIFLEPQVYKAFVAYAERAFNFYKEES